MAASPYFGGKLAADAANERTSTPRITVRAHTRAAPPKRVPLPPILNPKGDTRFTKPPPPAPAKPKPVNTQRVEVAHKAPKSREQNTPFFAGQKPARYETKINAARQHTRVPVYTLGKAGPSGQRSVIGRGGVPVTYETAQAQLGTTPSVGMSLLNSAVHPLTDLSQQALGARPFNLGGAVSDVANIGSNFVPVGKAAGILGGLRGLRALKDVKAGADVIDAGKAVEPAAADALALRGTVPSKNVRQLQKEQKALYSQERGQRFAAARVHLNNQNLAPAERVALAKNELRGELPKIHFQGFTELNDQAVTAMQKAILDHPTLMEGQKIKASDALTHALTGKLPTPSELRVLEHVFGKDTTAGLGSIAKHPLKDMVVSALNVPRSIMASFDLSAPFRQGLAVATRHPSIFFRNFKPMLKSFGSENFYRAVHEDIRARPTYPQMIEAKLAITDLGKTIGNREEQFSSDIAEKLTGGKRSPIRMSGRAYTGFLDKTRADVFDHLIQRAHEQGVNVTDEKFLKDLGRFINTSTGRGPLGNLQGAAPALNAVFFSPRLLASRLDLIFSPLTYAKADPFVRKEAIRSMVQLAGTASVLIGLVSQIKGVKVATDPRNPDWGKVRLGNTRFDIGGGFQQPLRLFAQLATGTAISSTTGKKLNLTAGGFGQPNRLDLFLRFFEGKESPITSLVTDWARGSNQVGQKLDWGHFSLKNPLVQRMLPLLAQDSYDLYNAKHGGMNGLAAAFAGYGVGSVGFGMQTYGAKPVKVRGSGLGGSYFGSSSAGGGSPYFGSP